MSTYQVRLLASFLACLPMLLMSWSVKALELGQLSLNARLGQSLQAEIALGNLNGVSVDQLKAKIGNSEAYKRMGMEYTPLIQSLQIEVQKRSNDTAVLVLKSDSLLRDPYLDLIVELSWPTGQLTKDYIVLLDPQLKQSPASNAVGQAPAPAPAAVGVTTPVQAASLAAAAASRADNKPGKKSNRSEKAVTVRYGDTAAAIAREHQPAGVSLDQMLLAILRLNAHAFVKNNVNRLRADVNLDIPSAESISNVSSAEARQEISAQAKDFAEYRRQLALRSSQVVEQKKTRQIAGKLNGGVLSVKPLTADKPPSDQLKLSNKLPPARDASTQAKISGKADAEEKLARLSALSQNLQQIKGLAETSAGKNQGKTLNSAGQADTPNNENKAGTAKGVGLALPAAGLSAMGAKEPVTAATASTATPALNTVDAVSKPVPENAAAAISNKPQSPPKSEIPVLPEDNGVDWLWLGLMALTLLAGLGLIYRIRQQKGKTKKRGDSIFAATRQENDIFFNVSGGGHEVDIAAQPAKPSSAPNSEANNTAMAPSNMEIDPLAEADVYLAYGREQQAEEILREARQKDPKNLALLNKLAEIYAQRMNVPSFEKIVKDVQQITGARGVEWEKIRLLGQKLAPNNPLYRVKASALSSATPEVNASTTNSEKADAAQMVAQAKQAALQAQAKAVQADGAATNAASLGQPQLSLPTLNATAKSADSPTPFEATPARLPEQLLNTKLGGDMVMSPSLQMAARGPELTKQNVATPIKKITTRSYDPQQIKLDLAKEFMSSNDFEGAKELIDEVVADGSPELRQRALQMRNELPKPPNSEQAA
jgi:pilus assembly protein FimV